MSDKQRDLNMFKLMLKDLVNKGIRDFGLEETLKSIVSIAMYISEKEVEKRKEKERKENEK